MDNARKKYVNIDSLYSGEILALLLSVETNDEEDIETIMNDSGTELLAQYESVISTNVIRKDELSD